MSRQGVLILVVTMAGVSIVHAEVVIETVPVGNPGNAHDVYGNGAVAYTYSIGKYEVTAGQYAEFLNAVAGVDTYGLYNTYMRVERFHGSGTEGDRYQYRVACDWADRPVSWVSWVDAARFANWLHNGQPTGAQDLTTTEDGSYFLNGVSNLNSELLAITRALDATWVIPSDNEWYKAAFHYNDGVTGNYFGYPTSSDSVPGYVNDSGRLSGTGSPFTEGGTDPGNYATYDGDGGMAGIGSPYGRTEVGEWENSESPYGTFDQGGNVWEWTETKTNVYYRRTRAGSFTTRFINHLHASYPSFQNPGLHSSLFGFRLAKVSEQAPAPGDFDDDGDVDLDDYDLLQDVDLLDFAFFQAAFTGPQ